MLKIIAWYQLNNGLKMRKIKLLFKMMCISYFVFLSIPNIKQLCTNMFLILLPVYIFGEWLDSQNLIFVARSGTLFLLIIPIISTYTHFIKPIHNFKPDRITFCMNDETGIVTEISLYRDGKEIMLEIIELSPILQIFVQRQIDYLSMYIDLEQ